MNQKLNKKLLLVIVSCLLFIGFLFSMFDAQFSTPPASAATDYSLDQYDPLGPKSKVGGNPITLASSVVTYVMGILGAVIFGVFIIGGVTILFSRGNAKQVEKGKKTLLYATLGLVTIFFSYAALNLIFTVLDELKK